jgi:hypothetical protein
MSDNQITEQQVDSIIHELLGLHSENVNINV